MRLELQSTNGDAQVVVNGDRFWISDPAQHTVYEGTLPGGSSKSSSSSKSAEKQSKDAGSGVPSIAEIQSEIDKFVTHADLSRAIPGDIAGQAAYTVQISPPATTAACSDLCSSPGTRSTASRCGSPSTRAVTPAAPCSRSP